MGKKNLYRAKKVKNKKKLTPTPSGSKTLTHANESASKESDINENENFVDNQNAHSKDCEIQELKQLARARQEKIDALLGVCAENQSFHSQNDEIVDVGYQAPFYQDVLSDDEKSDEGLGRFSQTIKTITSEPEVLEPVRGLKIELVEPVNQTFVPPQIKFGKEENEKIEQELSNMVKSEIITEIPLDPVEGEYLSNIFIRPKKPDGVRVILNLKRFNEKVKYQHFKMENLDTVIALMTPDAYMASIDFKQAYYFVGIHEPYLRPG